MDVDGNTVIFSERDIVTVAMTALQRQAENLTKQRKDAHGLSGPGWNEHIVGAFGEAAVAYYYDVWWDGALGNLDAADVGELQVRTRTEDWHNLILHKSDPDEDFFILAHYDLPRVILQGWIKAKDGKKRSYWQKKTGRPCFFVPQDKLNTDLSLLEPIIYGEEE